MEHVILWVNDTQSRVSDTILLHFKSAASLAKARKKDDQRTSKGQPVPFKHENLQLENSIRCTIFGFFWNHLRNLLLTLSKFEQIN